MVFARRSVVIVLGLVPRPRQIAFHFHFFCAGSVTWTTIATKVPNGATGGSLVWTVPYNAYISDYTYIRVAFSADSSKFLASDYFSVLPCKFACWLIVDYLSVCFGLLLPGVSFELILFVLYVVVWLHGRLLPVFRALVVVSCFTSSILLLCSRCCGDRDSAPRQERKMAARFAAIDSVDSNQLCQSGPFCVRVCSWCFAVLFVFGFWLFVFGLCLILLFCFISGEDRVHHVGLVLLDNHNQLDCLKPW